MDEIEEKDFLDMTQEIVKEFLQTVVIIDDEASFQIEVDEEKIVKKVKKPPKVGNVEEKEILKEDKDRSTHLLNAKSVTDSFASLGITCSILNPNKDEKDLLGNAINSARRSDVVLIDWMIHSDIGNKAKEIIKKIIKDDSEKDRLRLIVIYTGEPNIKKIASEIKTTMNKHLNITSESDTGDDFSFSYGKLKITVYAKEDVKLADDIKDRALSFEKLPESLIKEFSDMTVGIISNVTLESISTLRKNTHLILGRLNQDLDPPYLSHRALLPYPDDAMQHAIDIVSSEFYSLLQNYEIGRYADKKIISAWIKFNEKKGKNFCCNIKDSKVDIKSDDICEIQENGVGNSNWLKNYVDKRWNKAEEKNKEKHKQYIAEHIYKDLTETFCLNEEDPFKVNCKFAILTSMKSYYKNSSYEPALTLGSVVKDEKGKFWICIQPRCDSVRIEDTRSFLFLPLIIIEGDKKFDFVICEKDENFIKVRINNSIYNAKFFNFKVKSENESTIKASKNKRKNLHFKTSDGNKMKWICELKPEHAQRIANKFGSNITRVGLDESEWLRRFSTDFS
ncbi:MAG: hypothetical protein JSW62_00580 [Thermoplasmatales archaeon]|nr:MAG: hypothetical protein JSW62_00580 [Thermoplasmatales archaeon]